MNKNLLKYNGFTDSFLLFNRSLLCALCFDFDLFFNRALRKETPKSFWSKKDDFFTRSICFL